MRIPLHKPFWDKHELNAATTAIRKGRGEGDGPWSKRTVKLLQKKTGSRYVFPVSSGTHGLELALAAINVGSSDEVILPSFTMSSTANCVLIHGATPVFADIDPVSLNLDPHDVKRCIGPKTKGMIVVHYAGMAADMDELLTIAKRHNLFVIEDAAHAIGAKYKDKMLGTWGEAGVFSFHGTKNISCGEGGAVLTNNRNLSEKMRIYREHGTNRNAFLKGLVDRYRWVGKGSSYFLSDILASIVFAQLKKIEIIQKKREVIAASYTRLLAPYQEIIQPPVVPGYCIPNWHIYAVRFRVKSQRNHFIKRMRSKGIKVSSHFEPLHISPMGYKIRPKPRQLPITEKISETVVRLPIYPDLTKQEFSYIEKAIKEVLGRLLFRNYN